ncbi:MAG: hypothetical protein JKY46_01185 [Robiginitomaculum sp.]|nr:hypothetical protein [Robiginitomaculum sp.]
MSEQNNQTGNKGPVYTHRDGAISAKIWENTTPKGGTYHTVSFGRTYTDPKTGQPRESQSFQGTDLLKIQQLARESYRTIGQIREMKISHEQEKAPQAQEQNTQGLQTQRDAALNNAAPRQEQSAPDNTTPSQTPE